MKGLYPPFGDPAALPERVLVIAPHPDDEVFGCGGMLAHHAAQGATVRVLVLTDGAGGAPEGAVATEVSPHEVKFVIDDAGVLRHIDRKVDVRAHGPALLKVIEGLRK